MTSVKIQRRNLESFICIANCRHGTATHNSHQTEPMINQKIHHFKLVFSGRCAAAQSRLPFFALSLSTLHLFRTKCVCIRVKWHKLHCDVSLCVIYSMVCNTSIKFACSQTGRMRLRLFCALIHNNDILVYGYDYYYGSSTSFSSEMNEWTKMCGAMPQNQLHAHLFYICRGGLAGSLPWYTASIK